MADRKKRVRQHIMEDESYKIIRKYLPSEWVVREFNRPDYGIDIVIELFEKISPTISETLGEYIFVQVKSVEQVSPIKKKVHPVGNVSKAPWKENKSEYIALDVVKYSIDMSSIYTIHTLGASVPVILLLVDIKTENVYFICLNDYIDKILLPKNPAIFNQSNVTIEIPLYNQFKDPDVMISAFEFYGKRSKLLAAFTKFHYQKNEIAHLLNLKLYPVVTHRDSLQKENITEGMFYERIKYFITQIYDLDIWQFKKWEALTMTLENLIDLQTNLKNCNCEFKQIREKVIVVWHQLGNLANIYEDICREWFLPKFISLLTSYPYNSEIITSNQTRE